MSRRPALNSEAGSLFLPREYAPGSSDDYKLKGREGRNFSWKDTMYPVKPSLDEATYHGRRGSVSRFRGDWMEGGEVWMRKEQNKQSKPYSPSVRPKSVFFLGDTWIHIGWNVFPCISMHTDILHSMSETSKKPLCCRNPKYRHDSLFLSLSRVTDCDGCVTVILRHRSDWGCGRGGGATCESFGVWVWVWMGCGTVYFPVGID